MSLRSGYLGIHIQIQSWFYTVFKKDLPLHSESYSGSECNKFISDRQSSSKVVEWRRDSLGSNSHEPKFFLFHATGILNWQFLCDFWPCTQWCLWHRFPEWCPLLLLSSLGTHDRIILHIQEAAESPCREKVHVPCIIQKEAWKEKVGRLERNHRIIEW